jgi:hypothetical protein
VPRVWLALEEDETHGLHRRSVYKRCMQKERWSRFWPVDLNNHKQIRTIATTLYKEMYTNFAESVTPTFLLCSPSDKY